MKLWSNSQYFSKYTKQGRSFQWNWILNILKACFFLFQFLYSGFVWCQSALHLRQIKFESPLITANQMGWLGQLILDETDFRPDFLDLRNNFTFRRSCRLPVAAHKFLVVLVPTFGYHLNVVNCHFYFLKFSRPNKYKIYGRFLENCQALQTRMGFTWYYHCGFV